MKKSKKIILTLSAVTLTAGVLFTGIGYMNGGRFGFAFSDGKFISADSMEKEKRPFIMEKKKLDSVKNIDIKILSYANIQILPSSDNAFYLEYNLPGEYPKPVFSCTDGTLTLTQEDREPIAIVGFGFHASQNSECSVTLYVPKKAELNSCSLYSDSGNIQASDLTASDFGLGCDYGDVSFTDTEVSDVGTFTLDSGNFSANTSTVKAITVKNDSGNVLLNQFSSESAVFTLSYGDLDLTATKLGSFDCKSENGNVSIQLPDPFDSYGFNLHTEYGEIALPSAKETALISEEEDSFEVSYRTNSEAKHKIQVECENGNIRIG